MNQVSRSIRFQYNELSKITSELVIKYDSKTSKLLLLGFTIDDNIRIPKFKIDISNHNVVELNNEPVITRLLVRIVTNLIHYSVLDNVSDESFLSIIHDNLRRLGSNLLDKINLVSDSTKEDDNHE